MEINDLIIEAERLIEKFFDSNMKDKGGKPYTGHLHRVAEAIEREQAWISSPRSTLYKYYDKCYIVALLHDILEDTKCTARDLKEHGFDDEIIDAVVTMTHLHVERYIDYIGRVAQNDIARKVKIYDLEDNMDIRRLSKLTDKDINRIKKYWYCWKYLNGDISFTECENAIYGE